tara:strand:+ start:145 stop:717 length:573 start_codon:yes stop_codon:yes gene_type:complete
MAIQINGNGTISGISSGGLPAGCVTSATLASGVGGKILQVKSVTLNDAVSATAAGSTTFADIAGMSLTLTPAASTSKMLITSHLNYSCSHVGRNDFIRITKDGSAVSAAVGTSGSAANGSNYGRTDYVNEQRMHSMMHLDTAGTTNAITYKLQWSGEQSGSATTTRYLNRRGNSTSHGSVSSFTIMEVAA